MTSDPHTDPFCAALAGVVRKERLKRGFSVKSFSKKSGVSRQAIGNFENGVQIPIIVNLSKIAAGLGLKVSEISALAEDILEKTAALSAKAQSHRLK